MSDQQPSQVYERAIKLLSIRMHTSSELSRKLKQKGFAENEIVLAIDRLIEARLLNDETTALAYLESLINHKTWGYYGLKSKLLQKGIPGNAIDLLLSEHLSIEAETKIAEKFLKNKTRDMKAAGAMQRKGFRTEVIRKLISN